MKEKDKYKAICIKDKYPYNLNQIYYLKKYLLLENIQLYQVYDENERNQGISNKYPFKFLKDYREERINKLI